MSESIKVKAKCPEYPCCGVADLCQIRNQGHCKDGIIEVEVAGRIGELKILGELLEIRTAWLRAEFVENLDEIEHAFRSSKPAWIIDLIKQKRIKYKEISNEQS